MTPKLTPTTLSTRARTLSADVDSARWALARLALAARRDRVPDYLSIIATACRRRESTVSHWARTAEWVETSSHTAQKCLPTEYLPYSFFECCARNSDRLTDEVLYDALWTWHEEPGATLESFRAHIASLISTEPGDLAEFRKWAARISDNIRHRANDFGLEAHRRDALMLAADAVEDAAAETEGEKVAA